MIRKILYTVLLAVVVLTMATSCKITFGKSKIYVVFNTNGGTPINTVEVEKGTAVERPDDPEREGWVFVGWYHGEKPYDFTLPVVRTITLSARWVKEGEKLKYYSVVFVGDGIDFAEQSVAKNGYAQKPEDPNKEGYEFLGWYLDGEKFDFSTPITSDLELVATWQEIIEIKIYTVTFNSNGGSAVNAQKVEENSCVEVPSSPTRLGYDFDGWYFGEDLFDFSTPITSDIVLVAKWTERATEIKYYTVIFNSNGGSAVSSQTVEEGCFIVEPSPPQKDGFIFNGWYLDGELFDFSNKVYRSFVLDASWREVVEDPIYHSVTFDFRNGNEDVIVCVLDGEVLDKPENPTRENYEFLGWFYGEIMFDFSLPITQSLTLSAKWKENEIESKKYVVTVDFGYNSETRNFEISEGERLNELENPQREGYEFIGWFVGEYEYDFSKAVNSDFTITAKWNKIEEVDFPIGVWVGFENANGVETEYKLIITETEKYFLALGMFQLKIDIHSITKVGSKYIFNTESEVITFVLEGNELKSESGFDYGVLILTKVEN